MNNIRRVELVEGSSSKFWEVWVEGAYVHTQYGRIGGSGQRTQKDAGSVTAAETVSKKLLAEKLKKGYRDVTPTAAKTEARPAASKRDANAPPPLAAKTFDDVRAAVFENVAADGHTSLIEDLISHIVVWAPDATDEQVTAWIAALPKAKDGWHSQAAGRVAVQRVLAGQDASARTFLALAEKGAPKKDHSAIRNAMNGLIPAWWRLGQQAKADAAYTAQLAGESHSQRIEDLARVAALGGQVDRFIEHGIIGAICNPFEGEALVALFIDGPKILAKALNDAKEVDRSSELAVALARHTFREGKPERFLEMALAFPKVFRGSSRCIELALLTLATKAPAQAVKLAQRILDNDDLEQASHIRAASILARHAPDQAVRWAKKAPIAKERGYSCHTTVLAALGKTADARKLLAKNEWNQKAEVAELTVDRGLALDALRASLTDTDFRPCVALVHLYDLGERSLVDDYFEEQLRRLAALSPSERDLTCRQLAQWAGAIGRVDIGTKIAKAPSKGLRHLSAKELMTGCAGVGDHAGALAALALIEDPSERASAAMACLATAAESFVMSPRALPLVCSQTAS